MDIIVNVSQVAIIVLLSENLPQMASKKFKKAPHLSTLESMKYDIQHSSSFPIVSDETYEFCANHNLKPTYIQDDINNVKIEK